MSLEEMSDFYKVANYEIGRLVETCTHMWTHMWTHISPTISHKCQPTCLKSHVCLHKQVQTDTDIYVT